VTFQGFNQLQRLDRAVVMQVIKTTLTRRGGGRSVDDPVRLVTQYWSLSGDLLAEVDPFPDGKGADD
jgi:hypothetical protein